MILTNGIRTSLNLLTRLTDQPTSVKFLAAELGVKESNLQYLVRKLKLANLVHVQRGPRGGVFRFSYDALVTVMDVVVALGKTPTVTDGEYSSKVQHEVEHFLGTLSIPITFDQGVETDGDTV